MRDIIKGDAPMLPPYDSPFDRWSVRVLKDEMLVVGEKEIGGQQIPYIIITQGEMLMTSC